ncbi:MAG: AMP-binding protein [Streptococcaceae bacterium]|jgi:long-chain acyl-CoA synthetase|nr:AMP-binding protein [Streptococcaceae bacterium]MCH4176506.1 AMP-binding protein [Streptococcaceae bacterium]
MIDLIHPQKNDEIALVFQNQEISYQALKLNCKKYQELVTKLSKRYVFIRPEANLEFIYLFYALITTNHVPVLLPDGLLIETLEILINQNAIANEAIFWMMKQDDLNLKLTIPKTSLAELEKSNKQTSFLRESELLFIGFTSGTTGLPKGYYRGKASWVNSFNALSQLVPQQAGSKVAAFGPIGYSLNLYALVQALYFGQTYYLYEKFSVKSLHELLIKQGHCNLYLVPTMINAYLNYAEEKQTSLESPDLTIFLSGASFHQKSFQRCQKVLKGARLFNFYGTSETSFISINQIKAATNPDDLGELFPNVTLKLKDKHASVASDMLFSGYFNKPPQKIKDFQLSDDLILNKRNVTLIGRHQMMIKKGGEKIAIEALENFLSSIDSIQACLVFAEADEYYGETISAAIVWRKERQSIKVINQLIIEKLAKIKQLHHLYTVTELPLKTNQKYERQNVRRLLQSQVIESSTGELALTHSFWLSKIKIEEYQNSLGYQSSQMPLSYFTHLWQSFALKQIDEMEPILMNEKVKMLHQPPLDQDYQLILKIQRGNEGHRIKSSLDCQIDMIQQEKIFLMVQFKLGFKKAEIEAVLEKL